MNKPTYAELPLVYSCSGCSNIGQLANQIAVELDHDQEAEMSCIAGVGGGVPMLVKKATSGRKIIAIDGCPLHCVKRCLDQKNLEPVLHYTLTDHNLKKRQHEKYLPSEVSRLKAMISSDLRKIT